MSNLLNKLQHGQPKQAAQPEEMQTHGQQEQQFDKQTETEPPKTGGFKLRIGAAAAAAGTNSAGTGTRSNNNNPAEQNNKQEAPAAPPAAQTSPPATEQKTGLQLAIARAKNRNVAAVANTSNQPPEEKPAANSIQTGRAPSEQKPSSSMAPTMEDVTGFVFEEQPDLTKEEIVEQFSAKLQYLEQTSGTDITENLHRAMLYIKEHGFLADLLKPEDVGILVTACSRSYGFIAKTKRETKRKTAAKSERVNEVLGDLDALGFQI